MTSFSTKTRINASPETIWALLTDAPGWPDWNTTVDRVEGTIAPDKTVTVYTRMNPGRAFPARVTEFIPGKRMVWQGGMPLGLFKGIRTYTLAEQPDGGVEFSMSESYAGPLAPLVTSTLLPALASSSQHRSGRGGTA